MRAYRATFTADKGEPVADDRGSPIEPLHIHAKNLVAARQKTIAYLRKRIADLTERNKRERISIFIESLPSDETAVIINLFFSPEPNDLSISPLPGSFSFFSGHAIPDAYLQNEVSVCRRSSA